MRAGRGSWRGCSRVSGSRERRQLGGAQINGWAMLPAAHWHSAACGRQQSSPLLLSLPLFIYPLCEVRAESGDAAVDASASGCASAAWSH